MFESAILADEPRSRRRWTMPLSLFAQASLVSTLVIIPLIFTERLGIVPIQPQFTLPIRHAPAPPPEAVQQRSSAVRTAAVKIFDFSRQLAGPTKIPDSTPVIIDDAPPGFSVSNDVPYTGSQFSVQHGLPILPDAPPPAARPKSEPAAKPKPPSGPVPVGGDVKPPALVRQVHPVYPALARQARIEGVVRISAVLTRDGAIRSMHVISGHPLLVPSAVDAVQQWIYRPTLLNGQPVEVAMQIDVRFTLSQR